MIKCLARIRCSQPRCGVVPSRAHVDSDLHRSTEFTKQLGNGSGHHRQEKELRPARMRFVPPPISPNTAPIATGFEQKKGGAPRLPPCYRQPPRTIRRARPCYDRREPAEYWNQSHPFSPVRYGGGRKLAIPSDSRPGGPTSFCTPRTSC